jgi:protein required for attachment to host cells
MKQNRTWIVVADGAKARILLYTTRLKGVQQLPNSEFHDPHLSTHELVTDRQPRVHESVGAARHAVEPRIDPHKQREEQFLARLAAHLERAEQHGEFEHLVVVAPATALGDLRKEFGPQLQKRIFAEITHDYAHQSNDYVYQHIKDSLPL